MILGIEIENFDVFDNDKAGILIDDYLAGKKTEKLRTAFAVLMLL